MPVKSILLLSVMATLGSFVAAFGCGDGLTAYCGHKQGAACWNYSRTKSAVHVVQTWSNKGAATQTACTSSVIVSAAPSLTPARPLPHHKYGGSIALYHFRVPWELGHNSPDVLGANLKGL
ncbi:hypothetical protein PSTG_05835 [Puccinia striiformis f. sp. tritici PST-78]|uniref:CBM1 domain-containing protein n=2 Tax=Puccinia striiformis TaxID=27350 RepID=A0A0L0VPL0_9BASI|nr:hypothetical protein PSTG_05835 [Puccinia striiformis f. sp. tritici PST-78]